MFMKKFLFAVTALAIAAPATIYAAQGHDHHAAAAAGHKATGSELKEEMYQLDKAFREIVSGVALGNGQRVFKAIHTLHGKREATQHALHEGKIKLPKNQERANEFEEMDNEFHKDLELLASAAKKNDGPKMAALTKKLLDSCVSCHNTFRK